MTKINPLKVYIGGQGRLKEASELTGLTSNTIQSMARMNEDEIGGIRHGSYKKVKKFLGVDLDKFLKEEDINKPNQ